VGEHDAGGGHVIGAELGYTFAAPGWFWCTPLVLAVVARRALAAPAVPWRRPDPAPLPATWRSRLSAVPPWLEVLGVVALLIALARPVERTLMPPAPPGRDLMLVLDVSSSMAADDLAPGRTRLAVGKQVAREFVRGRDHDRIGLVTFARFADLRCPLTNDRDALAEIVGGLDLVAKESPEDATAIGAAVGTAAVALRRTARAQQAIVLVTDGEENVAGPLTPEEVAPLHAAQLCRDGGIRVHGIVVGAGNQKSDGRFVALDTSAVQQLAATTGGRFFTATDAKALAAVWAAIDALETAPVASAGVVVREVFAWAVAAALVLFAAARGLGSTWLRRLP
jgi:Ca-activated chloride channel family protein